jgi:2-polyprenyl-3-methyl-5-hydroxy-6-metoxy-1,4-benzoquinol methylase
MSKLQGKPNRASYAAVGEAVARALAEAPTEEPPVPTITLENIWQPQTDYEKWLFAMAWKDPAVGLKKRAEFRETLPSFDGPADGSDVLPPGAPPVNFPRHWLTTPIHFGSLTDTRSVRFSYAGGGNYTFNDLERTRAFFSTITAGLQPKRILDVGTGMGYSAFAYAELFPEAQVVAIDLAAHDIRFNRLHAARKGVTNIEFYLQHGGETVFEDASFDIVSEAYVLHEQPRPESHKILMEMKRLLRPGGLAVFADVIYDATEEAREFRVQRAKGPEPFLGEYMKLNLPALMRQEFTDVQEYADPTWDCMVWTGRKPT